LTCLQDRFVKLLRRSPIPTRQSPVYSAAIRQRHAAILGICALVDSYPYTVERWMPDLLANVLAEHAYDPVCFLSSLGFFFVLADDLS
jgi:proteasome activator subunit 4